MTELPDLPDRWTWSTLGEIALSIRNGVFVSRPASTPPGTRILRISAVRPNALDIDDVRYANPQPQNTEKYLIEAGDLLFTRYSGNANFVGACAVVREARTPTLHPDKLIRVTVDERIVSPFYVQYVSNEGFVRRQVELRLKTTAGQVGISGGQLRTLPIPVPPRHHQDRIVATIEEHLSRLDAAEALLALAEAKGRQLRRSILATAFSGNLVPQDPDDEPASVVLERIRTERSATPKRRTRKAGRL